MPSKCTWNFEARSLFISALHYYIYYIIHIVFFLIINYYSYFYIIIIIMNIFIIIRFTNHIILLIISISNNYIIHKHYTLYIHVALPSTIPFTFISSMNKWNSLDIVFVEISGFLCHVMLCSSTFSPLQDDNSFIVHSSYIIIITCQ